jgi:hypothetical protein
VIAATIRRGKLEQAAEGAGGVGVVVREREAAALPPLLRVPRRPVVFGGVRDLRQRRVRLFDGLGVRPELREQHGQRVLPPAGEDWVVVAADAVGDRVQRLSLVVLPVGGEHVVDDFARVGGKVRRLRRSLRQPHGRQVGKQRLALSNPDE